MKTSKKLLAGAVAATVMSVGAIAPAAQAEVSGSMGIGNIYLWRGIDLSAGDGTPSVNGSLDFSEGGFYAGIWSGSGDNTLGTEYDLYLGYGGEAGDFTYDLSLWSYQYPTAIDKDTGVDISNDIGDLMEAVISLGYGPVAVTYYHGLQDLDEYYYLTVGASFDAFSITYGKHKDSMSHIDFGYSITDSLAITLSQVVDDDDGAFDDDTNVAVSYSITIE